MVMAGNEPLDRRWVIVWGTFFPCLSCPTMEVPFVLEFARGRAGLLFGAHLGFPYGVSALNPQPMDSPNTNDAGLPEPDA